jgi:PadR family transcriptional regulator PadR
MVGPRMTLPTQMVLQALLEDVTKELYGLEICAMAGLPSGTIHPILARLEKVGWLRSRWEEIDPTAEGRPRRRYYSLDPNSISAVQAALHRTAAATDALTRFRPRVAGGEG